MELFLDIFGACVALYILLPVAKRLFESYEDIANCFDGDPHTRLADICYKGARK